MDIISVCSNITGYREIPPLFTSHSFHFILTLLKCMLETPALYSKPAWISVLRHYRADRNQKERPMYNLNETAKNCYADPALKGMKTPACLPVNHRPPTPLYMIMQQEFCFFACAASSRVSHCHTSMHEIEFLPDWCMDRKHGLGNGPLTIEHLTLRTQPITLRHQIINLLASLQHTLDSLMQHDLRLIKLLLNLHNTICLRRVLILHDVILEFWEGERRCRIRPGRAWVLG